MQSRPVRIVMRQRQRDFSASKCCMQQWLWDDMDSDMRLRVAYMCLCVAELHAVSGSPDLFQLTPELIQVMSTLPNLQPTLGFKCCSRASTVAVVDEAHKSAQCHAAAATASSATSSTSSAANTADTTNGVVFTSNKQRKKAMQQVSFVSLSFFHRDFGDSHGPFRRPKWRHGLARTQTTKTLRTSWPGRKRPKSSNSPRCHQRLLLCPHSPHTRDAAAHNPHASGLSPGEMAARAL
jgi:hypothetical protein